MKRNLIFLSAIYILLSISCHKEDNIDNNKYMGNNKLVCGFGKSEQNLISLSCLSKQSSSIKAELTTLISKPVTVKIKTNLKDFSNYITITPDSVIIPAGKREAYFDINVTQNNIDKITRAEIYVTTNNKNIIPDSLSIMIIPNIEAKISPEQRELLDYYKKTYDLDLYPLLGNWECNGEVVTYYGIGEDNDYTINQPNPPEQISNQITSVELSPLATKEKPILAMPTNAFGLSSYFGDLYRFLTIDNLFWYYKSDLTISPPASIYIMKKINFTEKSPETYDVGVYTLEIDPKTKQFKKPFLKNIQDIVNLPIIDKANNIHIGKNGKADDDKQLIIYLNEDDKKVVYFPFIFDFSVWNKCIEYWRNNPKDHLFAEYLKSGNISPYQILYNTTVDSDKWIGERDIEVVTNFMEPSLTLDYKNKIIHLRVSRDSWGATEDCGYTTLDMTCKKLTILNK